MNLYLNDRVILRNIRIADSFSKRFIGLLTSKSLNDCYLFIPDCNFIHTFFMRFTLDIIMLDKKGEVIYIKENLGPFRMVCFYKAKHTVELAAGDIKKFDIKKGDIIKLI